ncbi:MAG: hypothetical protein M3312_06485, partial [Actinomycetota bacterium]|nr:hypothetical protein [Actinomycetota bacterium]
MAAKRSGTRKVRPRTPARVTKKKQRQKHRGRGHPELVGLALIAAGLFLGAVLLLGWDGGVVGSKLAVWLDWLLGSLRVAVPLFLVALGSLMVARSSLVDVRPFRTGLLLLVLGLLAMLGVDAGRLGSLAEAVLGRLLGATGTIILGAFLVSAGAVLVTGASLGAIVRRSARAAAEASTRVRSRRSASLPSPPLAESAPVAHQERPVDGAEAYPDVVSGLPAPGPAPVPAELHEQEPDIEEPGAEEAPKVPFEEPAGDHGSYRLPDASVLRRSRPHEGQPARAAERTAEALVRALASFGVEATIVGQVAGPRVTRYELQLAAGT